MLVKNLRSILQKVAFNPKDSTFKILIDDQTSLDYILTKLQETIHHMRTAGASIEDYITLVRLAIIATHKFMAFEEKNGNKIGL